MFKVHNFFTVFILVAVSCLGNFCFGQRFSYNDQKWWLGHVKFQSGDSLYTKFQYNMETELVSIKQLNSDSMINVFPTSQIVSLAYFDPTWKTTRFIFSKPFLDKNNFEKIRLFELIYKNKAQLYVREQNNQTTWFKFKVLMKQQFLFYLSFDDGTTLIKFNGKHQEFLSLLPNKKEELATYLKTKNLDLHTYDDLLSALMYYDSLVKYQ